MRTCALSLQHPGPRKFGKERLELACLIIDARRELCSDLGPFITAWIRNTYRETGPVLDRVQLIGSKTSCRRRQRRSGA